MSEVSIRILNVLTLLSLNGDVLTPPAPLSAAATSGEEPNKKDCG